MRIKIRSTKADLPGRAAMWSRERRQSGDGESAMSRELWDWRLRIRRLWTRRLQTRDYEFGGYESQRLWIWRLPGDCDLADYKSQRLWTSRLPKDYESGDYPKTMNLETAKSNDYEARDCRFGRSAGFRSLELIFDMDVSDGNLSHFISLPACWDRRWNERGREWIQWERIDRKRRE